MKHLLRKRLFLSGATTIIAMSVIIFGAQKAFAFDLAEPAGNQILHVDPTTNDLTITTLNGANAPYQMELFDYDTWGGNYDQFGDTSLLPDTLADLFSSAPPPDGKYVIVLDYSGMPGYNTNIIVDVKNQEIVPPDNSTHFIDGTPAENDTLTPGSETVGFDYNVSPADYAYSSQMYFSLKLIPISVESAYPTIIYGPLDVGSSGSFSFSTTTTLTATGLWKYDVNLFQPTFCIFGVCWNFHSISEKTYSFNVSSGTSTSLITPAGLLASTTAAIADACTPLSLGFNAGDCLLRVLLPTSGGLNDDLTLLKETPPLGYIFRIIDIFNGNATVVQAPGLCEGENQVPDCDPGGAYSIGGIPTDSVGLPTISYTFASTSAFAFLGTLSFDPFGSLVGASSLTQAVSDQAQPETVWQILQAPINLIVYMSLFFIIFNNLLRLYSEKGHDDHNNK